jgi:hypothetical protein
VIHHDQCPIQTLLDLYSRFGIAGAAESWPDLDAMLLQLDGVVGGDGAFVLQAADSVEIAAGIEPSVSRT